MIERDRELLARLQRFNTALGPAVVELIHRQDGGELPADGLRALAKQYRQVADELDGRADERDAIEGQTRARTDLPTGSGAVPLHLLRMRR